MRFLRCIQNHPLLALGILALALGCWIIADLAVKPGKAKSREATPQAGPVVSVAAAPPPVRKQVGRYGPDSSTHAISVSMLPKLHPGMSRTDVERLVGLPDSDRVMPASEAEGRLLYMTAYELVDEESQSYRRSVLQSPPRWSGTGTLNSQVCLVYDASTAGHPLLEIQYLDPLF